MVAFPSVKIDANSGFLSKSISIWVFPFSSCTIIVFMFLLSYSESSFVPPPTIDTLEPSLFVTSSPELAPKFKPVSIMSLIALSILSDNALSAASRAEVSAAIASVLALVCVSNALRLALTVFAVLIYVPLATEAEPILSSSAFKFCAALLSFLM